MLSRTKARPRQAILLAVAVVLGVGLLAWPMNARVESASPSGFPPGFPPVRPLPEPPAERFVRLDQSVTASGIRVDLLGAEFSSTKTVLWVDMSAADGEPARPWRHSGVIFMPRGDVELAGFNPVPQIVSGGSPANGGVQRWRITAGAVKDPAQEVRVSFGRIQRTVGDALVQVEGPWSFAFVPGPAAVDPVNIVTPINQTRNVQGVAVSVGELRVSSTDTTVTASFDYDPAIEVQFPEPARLVLANGQVLRGSGPLGRAPVPGQQVQVRFPPVPDPTRSFTIEFGPAVRMHKDRVRVDVPVSEKRGDFSVGGGGAFLASFQVKEDSSLAFFYGPTGAGASEFTLTVGDTPPALTDNTGKVYEYLGGGGKFRRQDGVLVFAGESAGFAGPVPAGATTLTLTLPGYGEVLRGPWSFSARAAEG